LAGVAGVHGHLFYVSIAVDDPYEHECHGVVRGIRHNPGSAIVLEARQFIEGGWFALGHGRHAQFSK
jgi:hypothetical protein